MKKAVSIFIMILSIVAFSSAQKKDSTIAPAAPATEPASAPKEADQAMDEKVTNLKGEVDGINESYLATKSTVDKLAKIKISGYTQFQYRAAVNFSKATDTSGTGTTALGHIPLGTYLYPVGDFSGGKFGQGVGSLEQLRRARIKIAYETDLTSAAIQLDCLPFTFANAATTVTSTTTYDTTKKTYTTTNTPTNATYYNGGGVQIKNAYLRFTEPWLKSISLAGGVMDRPFGYEIGYSSGSLESPERSRTEQTIFPSEQDLGAELDILPAENMGLLQYFNLKGGAFTGNAVNVENDNERDFMGRFGFTAPLKELGLGIDGGVSGYFGKLTSWNPVTYKFDASAKTFTPSAATVNNYDQTFDRKYFGADLQLYYSLPVIGGASVRGELYQGSQPGFATSTSSPSSNVVNTNPVYVRNFLGYYAWLVLGIDPINSQLTLKYDSYDPNTDITGSDFSKATIGAGASAPTFADLKFNTLGIGWIYHWDENVEFMLYYDNVMPEKISDVTDAAANKSLYPYTLSMKADVVTFRVQYKF
jgi:hypothetical protein